MWFLNYPILFYDKIIPNPSIIDNFIGYHHFKDISEYWLKSISIFSFNIVFISSFTLLLSIFIMNKIVLVSFSFASSSYKENGFIISRYEGRLYIDMDEFKK